MIQITNNYTVREVIPGLFNVRSVPLGRELVHHNDTGIFQLGRLDHATLQKGALVKMHLHRDDEILSYMRTGTMQHKDSKGNDIAINNRHLMMMNAGSGIQHEEAVQKAETVEMLQIFFRPRKDGLSPNVQFHELPKAISENKWRLIGGPQESEAPLKINSEVKLYDTLLKSHSITTPELNKNKVGLLYVFDGRATIQDGQQDGQYIEKGTTIYFNQPLNIHTDTEAALVYFELDTKAQFSRNGMSTQ